LGEGQELIDGRKVTTLALADLTAGKVKFRRRQQH
jgi:hypothetical protein